MDEVGGALISIALTLCAVFVPSAFLSGITGAVLPPVRRHDRGLDGDLLLRLADTQPRALRRAVQAAHVHGPTRGLPAPAARGGFDRFNRGFEWLSVATAA